MDAQAGASNAAFHRAIWAIELAQRGSGASAHIALLHRL